LRQRELSAVDASCAYRLLRARCSTENFELAKLLTISRKQEQHLLLSSPEFGQPVASSRWLHVDGVVGFQLVPAPQMSRGFYKTRHQWGWSLAGGKTSNWDLSSAWITAKAGATLDVGAQTGSIPV